MKTYTQKVTELLSAIDALSGLLESDFAAVQLYTGEIDALYECVRALNTTKPAPVFVFVRGGVVTLVSDEAGEGHSFPVIVDYDNLENGVCPVCGSDIELESDTCEECGCNTRNGDNGIESAVKYYSKG